MIAALFVETGGAYFGIGGVDPWDVTRDARNYAGPWPVIAHPPCERWGRYWHGGPSAKVRRIKGDDGGCFASALASVRKWGGVLEHPAGSHAWAAFGLVVPSRGGYWTADFFGGHTIEVEQGHYGHLARKKTWLYAFAPWHDLPILARGPSSASMRLDEGFHSAEERRAARAAGIPPRKRLSRMDNLSTPPAFRDVLIGIARSARAAEAA